MRKPRDDTGALPDLIDLTYSATADPSQYDTLLEVWERYMERVGPGEVEAEDSQHLHHFNRALEILERIGRQKQQQDRKDTMVALFDAPAFIVGRSGRIEQTNASSDVPHLGVGTMWDHLDTAAFDDAVAELDQGAPVALVPLYDAGERLVDCAILSPLDGTSDRSDQFLLVLSGKTASAPLLSALQNRFALSASEADVLQSLIGGATVAEISEQRGVALATTRTQVRRLLEKTGSASLTDLIRQSAQISAKVSAVSIAQSVTGAETSGPRRYERILTSDGRLLAFRRFGAPEGRPVLYIHNMIGGPIWPASMERMAQARGWCVIAPSRPGFGISDSYSGRDMKLVRQTCSDMRALLDYLQVDKALVVGMMSSAGLGLRFARDHKDRVMGLLNVGHAGLMDDRMISAMANPARGMAKTYRKSPTALRFLIRVAVASVDLLGPDQMLRSNFRKCAPDAALLEDKEIVTAVGEGLRHAIAQGGEAFSRDGFVALHDWRTEAAGLNVPHACLLGREDRMYPVNEAARMMSGLPGYQLDVQDNAGQFVFFAHPEASFALMEKLWVLGLPGS